MGLVSNTKLTRFVARGLRGMPTGIHTVDLVPRNTMVDYTIHSTF